MKQILNGLRDFFGCTKREAQGFLLLLLLTIAPLLGMFWLQPVAKEGSASWLASPDSLLLDSLLLTLEPLHVADSSKQAPKAGRFFATPKTYSPKAFPRIDIATADTAQLQMLRGIGSVLAGRIVKFREKLGGFVYFEQVYEVYGLSEEAKQALKARAYLGQHAVRTLSVNRLPPDSLAKHPYVGYKMAKILGNYRKQHGPFGGAADLHKIYLADSTWVNKITPYLHFE
jgi:DNA uptake protein ComE-like DNA-binding protein